MRMRIWLPATAIACALCAQAGTLARFAIPGVGSIMVDLYDREKPVTVDNFIRLVEAGAYQNTFLHRCMPGFIAQGGGMTIADPSSSDLFASFGHVSSFGPITNEFGVGPLISNTFGTLAMAKLGGNPDSATCQWFFNLADNSANLDFQNGGFTVFGRVVAGENILHLFNSLSMNAGIVNLTTWYGSGYPATLFTDLPVRYIGSFPPQYNQLLHVQVSLVRLSVGPPTNGPGVLSWQSVPDLTNLLEESTSPLGAPWNVILTTNGAGHTISVPPAAGTGPRFYRLRFQ